MEGTNGRKKEMLRDHEAGKIKLCMSTTDATLFFPNPLAFALFAKGRGRKRKGGGGGGERERERERERETRQDKTRQILYFRG